MVIGVLQLPDMFLRGKHKYTHIYGSYSIFLTVLTEPYSDLRGIIYYFVLDLPPWQLTNQKLHQHVEERPQVIVTTHLLQIDTTGLKQNLFLLIRKS